jgi:hypothetical protein
MTLENVQPTAAPGIGQKVSLSGVVNTKLTLAVFQQLCGHMSGIQFIKVVYDKERDELHFVNDKAYAFHVDYVAEQCLGSTSDEVRARIDEFNKDVYFSPTRRFFLGILSLQRRVNQDVTFFTLETVEIDNMDGAMVVQFFKKVKLRMDPAWELCFKPANHDQEIIVSNVDHASLPRVFNHELYAGASFIPLNYGKTTGRIRIFMSREEFLAAKSTIEWFDILVMDRVPDDIPRVAGLINSHQTTPLSHTNVLAHGWGIPNAIQKGARAALLGRGLNDAWVTYAVEPGADKIVVERAERDESVKSRPAWRANVIALEPPQPDYSKIVSIEHLRATDRPRYGTKAANLGELFHLLAKGSRKLTGYYSIPRPLRNNLLSYLASWLGCETADVDYSALTFMRETVHIPRGIALPFAIQQRFLESSPQIQQFIGKLKMALELDAKEVDSLCVRLQQLIKNTPMSDDLRDIIDEAIAVHLSGVRSFVVRSSSNAEDLENFSAAGIYESLTHVTTVDNIFRSIKQVWASLVSPRSIRLRQQVGISLDDVYMGVIIQEQVEADLGGVMVTTNPLNAKQDWRNVYINASRNSSQAVVEGKGEPYQFLYNTVEGGGRTLALGDQAEDLSVAEHDIMQKLAFVGRLLQSHFSPDYTYNTPIDVEWAAQGDKLFILQMRPYAH